MKFTTPFLLILLLLTGLASAQSFEGDTGNIKTRVFETSGPWKLNWDFQGTGLKVFIYHADTSKAVGEPIRQAGHGQGAISMKKAGKFYLEIRSVGHYKLSVEEGTADAAALPSYSGNTERKGSPVFEAPKKWGFRCSSQGTVLKVTLYDANRKEVGEPIALIGGGTTTRYVGTPGKYFFMFQSVGPYQIELYQD